MNRAVLYCLLICFCLGLYACPFSSAYKLDDEPSITIDDSLLGGWTVMVPDKYSRPRKVNMMLSRKNDDEYNICFTGYLEDIKPYKVVTNDSISGTAFLSIVANRQFMNIQVSGQTYIAFLEYRTDTLSLLPLEDRFTAKYIRSNADLRKAVEVHFRTRVNPRFEDQFCLKDMIRVK